MAIYLRSGWRLDWDLVKGLPGSRSLRVQVLVPTAVLFAITLGLGAVFAADRYSHDVGQLQRDGAQQFVGRVGNALTTLMLERSPYDLGVMLQSMVAMRRDVEAIHVMRPDGKIAYSSEPGLVGTAPWPDLSRFEKGAVVNASKGEGFAFVRPIVNTPACAACHGSDPKRVDGWLDVRFSERLPLAAGRHLRRTLLLSSAAAFACLVGISWALHTFLVLRPVRRLLRVMRRVRGGELGLRTNEQSPNELGQVARSFDETLATLEAALVEVEAFSRERMIQADRFAAVGEMATALTHEIKNPLAGLSGAMEVLTLDLADMPRERDLVIEMRRQVLRVAKVVEGLLGFARAPRAKLKATNLNAALDRVLFLVRHQIGPSMQIEAKLSPTLPQVWADAGQIEQVLLNLCLNSVQAMAETGGVLRASTFTEAGHVVVEICDDGPGIPEEVRPHIFEAFFTTKSGGNGLGLATSARIIGEHGGHIDYRCPKGGGTIFRVTLHAAPRPDPDAPKSGSHPSAPSSVASVRALLPQSDGRPQNTRSS